MIQPDPEANKEKKATPSEVTADDIIAEHVPEPSQTQCPICKVKVSKEDEYFPFCSKRCRLIDFGKWMGGDYMVSRPIDQSDLDEV